ncbi:MAG TPA: cytochrome c oxidase subunit 3 [Usitatibacter sp.]|nr:cytochrome c oxidase subunit 3 [Usitatibacter sp.]
MANTQSTGYYFAPPSKWPVVGSTALLFLAVSGVLLFNGYHVGWVPFAIGFLILLYMLFGWFGTVIHESEGGLFNRQVDMSFRWAMSWFIFSEVMFFAAFFGALFYARQYSVPWLGDIENKLVWPEYTSLWPTAGPYRPIEFTAMEAWGIPAINTLLLLSSGVTVTWAHWALKKGDRRNLIFGLALTIILGVTFLILQASEYMHAYSELNLKLTTGVFGSTFFLLTGFHGFHVTLGATMLIVILFRCVAGHFRPDHHFAFEAVSWYWHFVDVVWLLLFVFVYWL